jgi:Cysteine rich repeat
MVRFVPLLSFVAAFAVLSPVVSAQPTQREHDACTRDVARHCRAVMNNGDQAVLACLREHRDRISRGCNKVLVDHGQ